MTFMVFNLLLMYSFVAVEFQPFRKYYGTFEALKFLSIFTYYDFVIFFSKSNFLDLNSSFFQNSITLLDMIF